MTAVALQPLPPGADPSGGGRPLPLLRHSLLLEVFTPEGARTVS